MNQAARLQRDVTSLALLPVHQFSRQLLCAVNLVQRLEHCRRVDGRRAALLLAEGVVGRQALQIAVEDDADVFARAVHHRASRVAADDVGCADEVKRRLQVQLRLALLPQRRQVERRLAIHLARALVETAQRRHRRNLLPIFLVAFHHAEAQAQRERRVWITRRAEQRIARARNRRLRLLLHLGLFLEHLAQCARLAIDESRDLDQRILRRRHRRCAAFIELLAERHVADLRSRDQLHRAFTRRFASENFLRQRIVATELPREERERIGQRENLQIRVNGLLGEQAELQ